MKTTTKAIFSLGLISFLILGGVCQNAFAVGAKAKANNYQHSLTRKHTGSHKRKRVHVKKHSSSVKRTLDKK
ncbi:hypothetical protein PN480_16700 [Dolichospermum circinale CS-1225]|uniref:Lipoprotein n=1 Tax=Dolichospermum circinale CS-537/01 TaxID=3021739 RepID=A0ABT5A1S1_9CYAN|nr:hypothetical protein [Dolichospermum circinale]MDB9459045.1 hypothetical protein [Dolichospermum circinale CS-545/17]MDB9467455.1 hypothetical protein [Dolichospermum circinale CS-539/09]MDB9471602.1 hypothetical protein [Dolichospermum circinale CS-539]MDB9485849.1 hypothetical protein [Dolichospermum circinale CS-537/01]MDB9523572.1 hypothetical protein [Dolichospermum circinale CS-1225]